MFATSNANFPSSILPTVQIPSTTTPSLLIATYRRMAESPEPLEMFDGEAPVVPATNSSGSSSGTSAYLALVLEPQSFASK
ncbi:hypothetical protein BCON_0154g00110 [Botryotinia convoluta]|uniref:Uncharacterized protein n=1 Tax=Botryotinia convoluta TaxID=54673 RepID=A0A4Z1HX94_9HELO|nr:hypothetical protein BCON_0154g00110 [Botryotinia convoluta]